MSLVPSQAFLRCVLLCLSGPGRFLGWKLYSSSCGPISPFLFFHVGVPVNLEVWAGCLWKCQGVFFPQVLVIIHGCAYTHTHTHETFKFTQFFITQIGFGFKPDILNFIIPSQNEHRQCVKYTFLPAWPRWLEPTACVEQKHPLCSKRESSRDPNSPLVYRNACTPGGNACLFINKCSHEFAVDELIHLAEAECFEARQQEVTN